MTDAIVVLVTASSEEEAERIARTVVEEKLAACVNVLPRVRSFYRWKGEMNDATECLMIAKTRRELFDALEKRVLELHSYEVPEVVALEIEESAVPYLDWIAAETREIEN